MVPEVFGFELVVREDDTGLVVEVLGLGQGVGIRPLQPFMFIQCHPLLLKSRLISAAEYRGADSHHGCAFGNCCFHIPGHTHR